ncbi:hypothetical protein HZC35_02330 [Candidatus Saganbacteria bacterium]|nr:hypothetical protein [Candidatus Saganbacteria bacterium]
MTRFVVWGAVIGVILAAVLFILNILNQNNAPLAAVILAVIGAVLGLIANKMTSK